MKKIFLILIVLFSLVLISCDTKKETKEDDPKQEDINNNNNNGENTGDPNIDPNINENGNGENTGDPENNENGSGENTEDPNIDPNINENGNGENTGNPENNENGSGETNPPEENKSLTFIEDDFKVDIVITNKDDNKKIKFTKDKYLEFFNKIKDFTYEKYGQCTSCDKILYSISYGDNVIDIYEYNFFKINDVLYELTSGSFDFLKNYEYSDEESSGWLPWI